MTDRLLSTKAPPGGRTELRHSHTGGGGAEATQLIGRERACKVRDPGDGNRIQMERIDRSRNGLLAPSKKDLDRHQLPISVSSDASSICALSQQQGSKRQTHTSGSRLELYERRKTRLNGIRNVVSAQAKGVVELLENLLRWNR